VEKKRRFLARKLSPQKKNQNITDIKKQNTKIKQPKAKKKNQLGQKYKIQFSFGGK